MRDVARGVEHAGDADVVARGQLLHVGVAERRDHFLDPVRPDGDAHSVTSLWRGAWHSIVTATGSEAMWQGYERMWMPSAVVSPPYPCGPMPSRLACSSRSRSSASSVGSGLGVPSSRNSAFLDNRAACSKVPPAPTPTISGGHASGPALRTHSRIQALAPSSPSAGVSIRYFERF